METRLEERSHLENKKEDWKKEGGLWCRETGQRQQAIPKEEDKEQTHRTPGPGRKQLCFLEPSELHTAVTAHLETVFLTCLTDEDPNSGQTGVGLGLLHLKALTL